MRVLVTGGAGYIGSVTAAQLVEGGHDVTVLDDLSTGHRWVVPEDARFVRGRLDDADLLPGLVAEGFDGVLHFAGRSQVEESVRHPALYFASNVGGTVALLDAMRAAEAPRLVFSSSAAVYGQPGEVPIPETALPRPVTPYGASKLAVDELLGYEAKAHGLAAVSLRYFNVAGASGRYGEAHEPETHLIPAVLQAAAGLRAGVQVFGTDYGTPDGTAVRDYVHVEDIARAHLMALEAVQPGTHRVYNVGNGTGFSVREVIETARRVTGRDIVATEAARRQPVSRFPLFASSSSNFDCRLTSAYPRRPRSEGLNPHSPSSVVICDSRARSAGTTGLMRVCPIEPDTR